MVKNFLIMLYNLKQVHLKLLLNEQFIKKAEATGDLIEKKNLWWNYKSLKKFATDYLGNSYKCVWIPKERYISRKKTQNYWNVKKKNSFIR